MPAAFPTYYTTGYMQQKWVQEALGVPLNLTDDSASVAANFLSGSGDVFRFEGMKRLEHILDSGVKVAFVYGDRDYRCNWLSTEAVSLQANWTGGDAFRNEAGYQPLVVNDTYTGGVVRQHGQLSFSRVFQAGHGVSAFQPETVYRIFMRAMFDKDVATGRHDIGGRAEPYTSKGLQSTMDIRDSLPAPLPVNCYVWDAGSACTENQLEALQNGTAVVKDFIVVEPAE